ncbi:CU044_2847 family protein [Streptomyces sp. NPDC054783]
MAEHISGVGDELRSTLIPLEIDGTSVYLSVQELGGSSHAEFDEFRETEISSRRPTLEQALDGLTGLARAMGARLQESDASRVVVEFGCDFALETGTFVAVVGKASTRSSFKVGLEWERPANS